MSRTIQIFPLGIVGILILIASAMSALISREGQKPLENMSVIVRSVGDNSLCVRTEAFSFEGAFMRLADCERIYQFYDGQKVHSLVETKPLPGFQILTVWAYTPDTFGIPGCLYPNATEVRVTSNCEITSSLRSWQFLPVTETSDNTGMLMNLGEKTCMSAPEIQDGTTLKMVPCDIGDINQHWVLENSPNL